MSKVSGQLKKMRSHLTSATIDYFLMLGGEATHLNPYLNSSVSLVFEGEIRCVECQKITKKSFGEGFCYNCFAGAASNSPCIIRPELCEGHLGIGRDIQWEKDHHVQEHIVYLALSSQVKVGVTRAMQLPTRWIDQGASQAIVLARTPYRQLAGIIEVALKGHLTDKTSWQKMLKNEVGDFDLVEEKWRAADLLPRDLQPYVTEEEEVIELPYPVIEFPAKVSSVGFEKFPTIEGVLKGIKGQYLLLDNNRVLNLRSHSGYVISFNGK